MNREWNSGDVALVNGRVCMRVQRKWEHGDNKAFPYADHESLDVRPLVVIDPEDAEQIKRLESALADRMEWTRFSAQRRPALADALREFATPTPPKPDEPTGLGAVVIDKQGVEWVRTEHRRNMLGTVWSSAFHTSQADKSIQREYADIQVVSVLSPGYTPTTQETSA